MPMLPDGFLLYGLNVNHDAGYISYVEEGLGARSDWCNVDMTRHVHETVDFSAPNTAISCPVGTFVVGVGDAPTATWNDPNVADIDVLHCLAPLGSNTVWGQCYNYPVNFLAT